MSTIATGGSDFGRKHVARGIGRLTDHVIQSGKGSYITLNDGRGEYLDFTSGIGVTGLGHCHPKVSQAAADQCFTLVHGQVSIAFHKPYLNLIERLLPVMPHPSLDSFFFWNSGSEAIEAAIKLVRTKTGRPNIITMQGGYHGRTFGAMALTRSKTVYSQGVAPLMPGVFTTPFPYWHQMGVSPTTSEEEISRQALYQLELVLLQQSAPADTAAILIEPVLGEGGYVPAPPAFLRGLREIADKNKLLLIFDEVQCGFGRTGKYFASEYSGVVPDVLVIAKGLANGFPLSGIVSRKEITDSQSSGSMGGTYAGNAVACAAATASAEVMQEEKVLHNVSVRSAELFAALDELRKEPEVSPHILDVRGVGLMVGVEFSSPSQSTNDPFAAPNGLPNLAARISKRCQEKGLFILTTSLYQVIRFVPPLNITQADMAKGLSIFREAVREVVRES
ncbi:hypothetical protein BS47DRAFT_1287372 [Hydnum rufescens UP504]|uniref:4-aminobutyrate aminotransferase n=1 Tax=Hydnum rufescens UP504 TaxID=1448309 RepID=A0A9P6B9L5_9AGAM|nr:hypothetical protein BS47DRAFT_1287372 [Hydnum rufescens UP504]